MGGITIHTIKKDRKMVQGDLVIATREIQSIRNGKPFKRIVKSITPTQEKVIDTVLALVQNSDIGKSLNYKDLREEVLKANEHKIKELGDKEKEEIYISTEIDKLIKRKLKDVEFTFEYNEFVKETGIKQFNRVSIVLKELTNINTRSSYTWDRPALNKDNKIVYEQVSLNLINSIIIVFTPDIAEKYTLKEFTELKLKGKVKKIEGIKISLNTDALGVILGIGRDFTKLKREFRKNFEIQTTFRFDEIIRSIENVSHISNFTTFEIHEFLRKVGVTYDKKKYYAEIKRSILDPMINDFNKHTKDMNVKMEAISKDSTTYLKFIIKKYNIEKIIDYIFSRIIYFSKVKIDNRRAFKNHIKNIIYDDSYDLYGKTIKEHRDEATYELSLVNLLINLLNYFNSSMNEHYSYDKNAYTITINGEIKQDITSPSESILYLTKMQRESSNIASIKAYIPFRWNGKTINSIIRFNEYKDEIINDIISKNIKKFENVLDDDYIFSMFIDSIENGLLEEMLDEIVYRINNRISIELPQVQINDNSKQLKEIDYKEKEEFNPLMFDAMKLNYIGKEFTIKDLIGDIQIRYKIEDIKNDNSTKNKFFLVLQNLDTGEIKETNASYTIEEIKKYLSS